MARVTVAADLDLEFFPGRAGGEAVAARAGYPGVVIKFRVYFLFHGY